MRRIPRLAPLLPDSPLATDAHRVEAFALTEMELQRLKTLVQKLDLPVTAIEIAADIYVGHLNTIVTNEHYKTQMRIDQKVKQLTTLRLDNDPNELRKARMQLGARVDPLMAGMAGDVIDSDLYALSEAELDAQISKLSAK